MTDRWVKLAADLRRLGDLDHTGFIYGVKHHRYHFGPKLTQAVIDNWQEKHNATLPPDLADYYTHVGNGGPSPSNGIPPLEKLGTDGVDIPFKGIKALRELAKSESEIDDTGEYYYDDDHEWMVDYKDLHGLICVEDLGCGAAMHMTTHAPHQMIASWDGDMGDEGPLFEYINDWASTHLNQFDQVQALIPVSRSYADMIAQLSVKHDDYRYFTSVIHVPLPDFFKYGFMASEGESLDLQLAWLETQFQMAQRKARPTPASIWARLFGKR